MSYEFSEQLSLFEELPRCTETIIRLFEKLGIPEIPPEFVNLVQIGKGGNSIVYKGTINDKVVCLKTVPIYMDNGNIYKTENNDIITQTGINDIIISKYVDQTREPDSLGLPTVQKIYGYVKPTNANNEPVQVFGLVKEYYDCDMEKFIGSSEFTELPDNKKQELLTNLILHILLTIKIVFTDHFKGRFSDASLKNILIQKTDLRYVQYGDKKIRVLGYLPVLCDFGASRVVVNGKIFMRTNWRNDCDTVKMFNQFRQATINNTNDQAYDIFVFFLGLRKYKELQFNEPIMEAYTYLYKKGNNFDVSWKNYKKNCVVLDNLFKLKSVKQVITNNELIE